ncbi:TolB family protein [Carnobacterium sp.]|uniref:TolB family protein n=1 Tax=Carnobacterium sp. TaxID=48221 RepID=UPI003C745225
MKIKISTFIKLTITLFFCVSFLFSCSKGSTNPEKKQKEQVLHEIPIEYENFRKIIGWVSDEEILVHAGEGNKDTLYLFNLFDGKMTKVHEANAIILTAVISDDKQKIFVQSVGDENRELKIINLSGTVEQQTTIETNGYLNINWNPVDQNNLFISYYQLEEEMVVQKWDISTNQITSVESSSLTPVWYSANLYLFVDNLDDFSLQTGELYMGDIRTNKVTHIRNQVTDFYLNNDTFITFSPSDFNKDELLLNRQYPFMVDNGFITVPKVSMNDRLIFPYLTQSSREQAVYGVIAKESTQLEVKSGEFQFSKLNFDSKKIEPIVDLPDNAPISISKDGNYSLYGWRYEYMIDLEKQELYPLIKPE